MAPSGCFYRLHHALLGVAKLKSTLSSTGAIGASAAKVQRGKAGKSGVPREGGGIARQSAARSRCRKQGLVIHEQVHQITTHMVHQEAGLPTIMATHTSVPIG